MENPAPRSFDFSHVVVHRINAFPFLIPAQYGDRRGYRTDNTHIIEPTWKSRLALRNGFILSNPHYSIATTRCIEDRSSSCSRTVIHPRSNKYLTPRQISFQIHQELTILFKFMYISRP